MSANNVVSLDALLQTKFPPTTWLVEKLLQAGETALLIGRQKEGKSTLALQLAIDIATGRPFLAKYPTAKSRVLYVDFENKPAQLAKRGADLAKGRRVSRLMIKAFDLLTQRDVGLTGKDADELRALVAEHQPDLLIIDPLRFAAPKGGQSKEENWAVEIVDAVSTVREANPQMAVLLVHHLRKSSQEDTLRLKDDPRVWIEKAYGSQALIAHVDAIWGLEAEADGFTFATVPRSYSDLLLKLEKHPDSQRFLPASNTLSCFTAAQCAYWAMLPDDFTWTGALNKNIPNGSLDRLIRRAEAAGLLEQDVDKVYRKVGGTHARLVQ